MVPRPVLQWAFSLFVIAMTGCPKSSSPPTPPASSSGLALVDITVIPGDGQPPKPHQTVIVADRRIRAIGDVHQIEVPTGMQTVSGLGRHVMPGLADMHAHLPDADPNDALSMTQYLALQLAAGVTTVRSMRGTPEQIALRNEIEKGEVLGPRLFVAKPLKDLTADQVPTSVAQTAQAGYDLIKPLGGLDLDAYEALMVAAKHHRLKVAGHVPRGIPLKAVLASGQGVEHFHAFSQAMRDGVSAEKLAQQSKEAGIFHCPTLDFLMVFTGYTPLEVARRRPHLDTMPTVQLERWEKELAEQSFTEAQKKAARTTIGHRHTLIRALDAIDAGLLLSNSHGPYQVPGWGMLSEMRVFETAGLTPLRILKADSYNAALFFEQKDGGRVASGYRADLVVLSKDPTKDLENVHAIVGVILQGNWHDGEALKARAKRLRNAAP